MSDEDDDFVPPLDLGITSDLLQQILEAKRGDPNKFQSFWEMDSEGVDDTADEIQITSAEPPGYIGKQPVVWKEYCAEYWLKELQEKNPQKKILWAAENNLLDCVKELLENDPDLIRSRDEDGYSALHRASYNGHANMVQYLIEKGAEITALTNDGWIPLHSAARWDQSDVLSLLLQYGSDINAQTNSGQTALHLAAYEHCRSCLEILLMHKDCDTRLKNQLGETAYQICARTSESCALFEIRDESINKL